jgi:hypothetical protein
VKSLWPVDSSLEVRLNSNHHSSYSTAFLLHFAFARLVESQPVVSFTANQGSICDYRLAMPMTISGYAWGHIVALGPQSISRDIPWFDAHPRTLCLAQNANGQINQCASGVAGSLRCLWSYTLRPPGFSSLRPKTPCRSSKSIMLLKPPFARSLDAPCSDPFPFPPARHKPA